MNPVTIAIGLVFVFLLSWAGSTVTLWIFTRPKTPKEYREMMINALFLTTFSVALTLILVSI